MLLDFRELSAPMWGLAPFVVLAAVILVFGAVLRSPWFMGLVGEWQVRFAAWIGLDKSEYHGLHDVTLPTPDGTTQIDHVFVSRYGVFVVETKNYSGWIFGGPQQSTWTQKIYRTTHKFQNPLRQNYKHIKALEALLDIPAAKLHSVVVFVGNGAFRSPMPPNVTYGGDYIGYIRSFREPVLSAVEVEGVVARIRNGRLKPGMATSRAHVRHLKARGSWRT